MNAPTYGKLKSSEHLPLIANINHKHVLIFPRMGGESSAGKGGKRKAGQVWIMSVSVMSVCLALQFICLS